MVASEVAEWSGAGVPDNVLAVIKQHRDDGERERRLSMAIIDAMRHSGMFTIWVPKEYGGREAGLRTMMETVEAIARVDGASAWVFANSATGSGLIPGFFDGEGARDFYSSGINLVAAGTATPTGRAVPVEGGYRISGRWPLVSGSHHAEWLGIAGLVFEGEAPRMIAEGVPELRLMFVRPGEAQIIDTWDSLGLRGTGSTDLAVADLFVPERRTLSMFTAKPVADGALYRIGILPLFAMALAAVLPGIARAAIDEFVQLAKQKTPTMSQTGLAVRPTIHAEVARAEAQLQSARAYLYEVADQLMDAVQSGGAVPDELEAKRRLACTHAGLACRQVVDNIFALAGATPVYKGTRLEQSLRDAHTASQHLFVSPVWWEKTGQYYFGLGLGMP